MKVLLLSAYDAASHRHWWKSLGAMFPQWQWEVLSLPARHFSWRIRGNSLSWSQLERDKLEQPYDLVVATSMVDWATLRGLVPNLTQIPSLLYFHENQFDYPVNSRQQGQLEAQITSIYSALAADQLVFNSRYNQETFLAGVEALLTRLPDFVPEGIAAQLQAKAEVLPVPVAAPDLPGLRNKTEPCDQPLSILWNHRWEYDKGPERLLAIIQELARVTTVDFQLSIVGQQFRSSPSEFDDVYQLINNAPNLSLGHWGYIESQVEYQSVLVESDVVLSTALHDFQGISVLEAVAAGCTPLVPDRLAYPEFFDKPFRYMSDIKPSEEAAGREELSSAVAALLKLAELKISGQVLPKTQVEAVDSKVLQQGYQRCFECVANPR